MHVFFPLPKFNESHDIIENKGCFEKIYPAHPFQIHHFLKNHEFPNFDEQWQIQLNSMEPNYLIENSIKQYNGKIII